LQELASRLSAVPHVIVLRGGQSRKELEATRALLAKIPGDTKRVILATGKFIGEGFDDSRWTPCFWRCRFRGVEPLPNMSAAASAARRQTRGARL